MNDSRLAIKVGGFVVLCLVLMLALLLSFGQGVKWFTPTYELRMRAESVGGLRKRSLVMMSGVEIGNVVESDVAPNGKGVIIRLKLQEKYKVRSDAKFSIEQIGFLGDQYVAIDPNESVGQVLQPGDEVISEEPLSIQEVVRTTRMLMEKVDGTVTTLDMAIQRLEGTVLSGETLTNIQVAINNISDISGQTLAFAGHMNGLVASNKAPVSLIISNITQLSETLNQAAEEVRQVVADKWDDVESILDSVKSATHNLDLLVSGLSEGEGAAGAILKDDLLQSNLLHTASSVQTLTSNLNRFGLLYKPKKTKPRASSVLQSPREASY